MRHRVSTNSSDRPVSRRTVLTGVAVTLCGTTSLAGCLGDDDDAPDPRSLDDGQYCDSCGMEIAMHPGPTGQAFYTESDTESLLGADRDGPAWFCSVYCTYDFVLDRTEDGYDPVVTYATDYSSVDYELTEEGGATVISPSLRADEYADASELTYVAGSDVSGAMGGSLLGFSDAGEAENFASEHGGDIYDHDSVSRELLASL